MIMLTNENQKTLRNKYFPHVPWTELGPVRRVYLAKAAEDNAPGGVIGVLEALARREGFLEPQQIAVIGDGDTAAAAFCRKPADNSVGMIFGTDASAHWCDIAADAPDGDGWQRLIVRSEEGENLTALSYDKGLLRFRPAT